ncbi:hypothetical protein [Burkholderia sola]
MTISRPNSSTSRDLRAYFTERGTAAPELRADRTEIIAAMRKRSGPRYFEMYHSASALARDG